MFEIKYIPRAKLQYIDFIRDRIGTMKGCIVSRVWYTEQRKEHWNGTNYDHMSYKPQHITTTYYFPHQLTGYCQTPSAASAAFGWP